VEVRTGAIVKNSRIFSVDAAISQNSIFAFYGTFKYPAHSLEETVYPKPIVPMESRDSEGVCLLLVWRVCDQAFGKYRPLNAAEKWSRDQHAN